MTRDGRAKRAVSIAYAQRILAVVIALGSTAMLSRLLGPTQFGYAAMATTVMNFLIVFRDFGLTSTTIQRPELTEHERDALFWMNATMVTIISIVAILIAPLVGLVYQQPFVTSLMSLAAAGFFISGIAAQHAAILRRAVAYEKIFVAELGGIFVGACASIGLAYVMRNAYALILGTLAQSLVTAVAFYALDPWRPGRPESFRKDLSLLIFGGHVAVYTACNYITNNIAVLLLGVTHATSTVGFYNRAQSLYELPRSFVLGPFLQVQFIFLCQEAGDPAASRRRYLQIMRLTSLLFIPSALVVPVVAHELVALLLGPQWRIAADILSWLMPAQAALGAVAGFGQFLTSRGKVSELRRWGYADVLIRGGGAAIGSYFGAIGAAIGFSLSTLLVGTPIQMAICARLTNVSIKDQIGAVLPGVAAGIAALVAALAGVRLAADMFHADALFEAGAALLAAGVVWAVVVVFTTPIRAHLTFGRNAVAKG